MSSTFMRVAASVVAVVSSLSVIGSSQERPAVWLDSPEPAGWNTPAATIPLAPKVDGGLDARCRSSARPAQLSEDMRVRERGWDLVGSYQGGWPVVVIRATAGYDGMCRPRQYQDFVFVGGVFAGTLSPQPMDSRSDGAIAQVSFQSPTRLTANYARYAADDALCCPSKTTSVIFDVATDPPVVRPVSASTANAAPAQTNTPPPEPPPPSAPALPSDLAGTSWHLVKFEGGDGTVLRPSDRSKYTMEFAADGRLTMRIDCNRGRGVWTSPGPNQIAFRSMSMTRAACPPGSLYEQLAKQSGNIRSYVIRDGHLFLALMADSGIYEFEPPGRRK
jgi:heat shock protein HslJ